MSIPLPTTTITVLRPDSTSDDYENDTGPVAVASGINAHIGSPRGRGSEVGGQAAVVDKQLICDVINDLRHTDLIRDNSDQRIYSIVWVDYKRALGLDHISAGLKIAEGASL